MTPLIGGAVPCDSSFSLGDKLEEGELVLPSAPSGSFSLLFAILAPFDYKTFLVSGFIYIFCQ